MLPKPRGFSPQRPCGRGVALGHAAAFASPRRRWPAYGAIMRATNLARSGPERGLSGSLLRPRQKFVSVSSAPASCWRRPISAAPRVAAVQLASIAAEIIGRFTNALLLSGSELPDTRADQRGLIGRVAALDPVIMKCSEDPPSCVIIRRFSDDDGWSVRRPGRLAHHIDTPGAAAARSRLSRGGCRPAIVPQALRSTVAGRANTLGRTPDQPAPWPAARGPALSAADRSTITAAAGRPSG